MHAVNIALRGILPNVPPPEISNIFAPPAIFAVILALDAPFASIIFMVSVIPVSAYFILLVRPVSIFSGNIILNQRSKLDFLIIQADANA